MSAVTEQELASLEAFSGEILRPGENGYDEARRGFNGLIDKRPALIARCRGEADIADAIAFARDAGLEISVRGGGHSVAGRCFTEGGLMIDLSLMKGIYVDPSTRIARVQPGVNWSELNRETQLHGLAVTGGLISTTGISGLTLGGGLGWLMAKFGLATDNLLSARVVTADGRTLTASEQENADLFWGLRGGGGNFGVVSSFEYRLHEVGPTVTGGLVAHPFDAAGDVLRFFRDFTADAPDELLTFAGVGHAPDGSGAKIALAVACHVGAPEQAEEDLRPLREFGSPIMVELGPLPYTAMNSLLDAALPNGQPQLLEVRLPQRALGRGHRRAARPLRGVSVADDRGPLRALPRRGDAGAGRRNRGAPPRAGLQPRDHVGVDRPGRDPGERRLDQGHVRRDGALPRAAQVPELLLGGRRRRRPRTSGVRTELRSPCRAQEGVRPGKRVPAEREYPA